MKALSTFKKSFFPEIIHACFFKLLNIKLNGVGNYLLKLQRKVKKTKR